jgi:hypothetical protein
VFKCIDCGLQLARDYSEGKGDQKNNAGVYNSFSKGEYLVKGTSLCYDHLVERSGEFDE